jgi:uncharacterized protein YneF (UPF0154 family)
MCAGAIITGFRRYIASQMDSNPPVQAQALHRDIKSRKEVSSSW